MLHNLPEVIFTSNINTFPWIHYNLHWNHIITISIYLIILMKSHSNSSFPMTFGQSVYLKSLFPQKADESSNLNFDQFFFHCNQQSNHPFGQFQTWLIKVWVSSRNNDLTFRIERSFRCNDYTSWFCFQMIFLWFHNIMYLTC